MTRFDFGWTAEKRPLSTLDAHNNPHALEDRHAVVRVNPNGSQHVLGIVSPDYEFVSHQEMFALVRPWVMRKKIEIISIGEAEGGKKVWIQLRLRGDRQVGEDILIPYLLLVNGFDGHTALHAVLTPMRVICENVLVSARRVGDARRRPHRRQQGQGLSASWLEDAIRDYRWLIENFNHWRETPITNTQLLSYIQSVVPAGRNKEENDTRDVWRKEIYRLAWSGKGNATSENQGTLWAAYNGATEFFDHHRKGRTQVGHYFSRSTAHKRRAFVKATELHEFLNGDNLEMIESE